VAVSKDGLQYRFVIPGTRAKSKLRFAVFSASGKNRWHIGRFGHVPWTLLGGDQHLHNHAGQGSRTGGSATAVAGPLPWRANPDHESSGKRP
jgi:hypothetical protein